MTQSSTDRSIVEENSASTDVEAYHRILASERRRLTIESLLEGAIESTDLETLATAVATRENGGYTPTEAAVTSVTVDLHHAQLPKLADWGALEYDPIDRRIDPSAEAIESLAAARPDW